PRRALARRRSRPAPPGSGRRGRDRRRLTAAPARRRIDPMGRIVTAILGAAMVAASPALAASGTTYDVSPVANVSASCAGQNAEVEQAVDQKLGYVYETWM